MECFAHVVILSDSLGLEDHGRIFEFRQVRHLDGIDFRDQSPQPLLPLAVQLRPVLVVVRRAFLKDLEAPLHFIGIGDRVRGDVDAAIDDAVLDPQRGRKGKHPRGIGTQSRVGHLRGDRIESRHWLGKVHRVVEPEALVVLRPETRKERVKFAPAFSTGNIADLRGQRKRFRVGRAHR